MGYLCLFVTDTISGVWGYDKPIQVVYRLKIACGSKVQNFGFLMAGEQAFQRLKKAAENQQKTGLARSNSTAMRLPAAFLAQTLDFKGLPKPG